MYLKIILYLALFLPAMPKIQIVKGVTMYPLEAFLLLTFPYLFIKSFTLKTARIFYSLWGILFLTTLLSQLEIVDMGGILRCVKGMIYIPLIYVGYELANKDQFTLKSFLFPFVVATIINLFVLFSMGFSFGYVDIWNNEIIGSGLSNKAFDIEKMKITILPGGAHGAWGNYNALILAIFLYFFQKKELPKILLSGIFLCILFNLGMSVSRESIICVLMIILFFMKNSFKLNDKSFKINKKTIIISSSILTTAFILLQFYKESLYIIAKIEYTIEAIVTSGTIDTNLLLRINGWKAFFYSLEDNPLRLLFGYGFNFPNYRQAITSTAGLHSIIQYASVPESFFIEMFAFGGIVALIMGCKVWKNIFSTVKKIGNKYNLIFKGYFFGLLIVNLLSGASLFTDFLYAQILLFLGLLLNKKELFKDQIETSPINITK